MPGAARIDMPGLLQHVIARGVEQRPVFLDDRDRERFVSLLSKLLTETESNYSRALVPGLQTWKQDRRSRPAAGWLSLPAQRKAPKKGPPLGVGPCGGAAECWSGRAVGLHLYSDPHPMAPGPIRLGSRVRGEVEFTWRYVVSARPLRTGAGRALLASLPFNDAGPRGQTSKWPSFRTPLRFFR